VPIRGANPESTPGWLASLSTPADQERQVLLVVQVVTNERLMSPSMIVTSAWLEL
jgi:hypothetical protein